MNESEKQNYFSVIKLCCMMILTIYFISSSEKSLHAISVEWFLLATAMVAALCFEITEQDISKHPKSKVTNNNIRHRLIKSTNKKKFFFLLLEISLTSVFILFFRDSNNGLFLLPMVILDIIIFFHISFVYCLFSFLGVCLRPDNIYLYMSYCLFISVIYFQNFIIIEKYRKYLGDFERKEYQLKDSISSQDDLYKEQLRESSLAFENKMLEEKARLSQALHDKLGHSINGSVYQLEASKVLMEKEPEQSKKIVQGVIDNLRSCMDEIRIILRREKPDKKRLAYLQLVQLCAECKDKYGIHAEFHIKGEDKEITEQLWEVILDNAIEAVTNALKYANCTQISIEIVILHKVIRCSIQDNGIGCETLKEGMGIQGMKSRTRKVNGYIDLNSDNGFHINMIIPLSKEALNGED